MDLDAKYIIIENPPELMECLSSSTADETFSKAHCEENKSEMLSIEADPAKSIIDDVNLDVTA